MSVAKRKAFGLAAVAALGGLASVASVSRVSGMPAGKHNVATARVPLSFEVNRGQAAANAKFVARGAGYTMALTDRGEPVLTLPAGQAGSTAEGHGPGSLASLRMAFPGSNPAPQTQGEELLTARSNYLIGNDRSHWLTGVPHYARVRYREVYPGVDVLYYAKDQKLEYDFVVRPGANPDSIRMTVQGAEDIEQEELGSLALKTGAGSVRLHKPVAYQEGPEGEMTVGCDYIVESGEIRFALGEYDHSRTLRIDPILTYAISLDASISAVAVDGSGNTYLAGRTLSSTFPTTPGVLQGSSGGGADALIVKLDPNGSTLLFATYLGGSAFDSAEGVALDSSGNITIAGRTNSSNFPVNRAFQSTLLGGEDAFVSRLNADATDVLYSSYLGGSLNESARGVALDAAGRAVVTGETNSRNFPTTSAAFQAGAGGGSDGFIAKVDTTQSGAASLLWSSYLGGSGDDLATAVAVDGAGSAYVTGLTRSADFPTAQAFQPACGSCGTEFDAFITKVNAAGTALAYSTFLGGKGRDAGHGIAVDATGSAYVAGETLSNNFPITTGAFQAALRGTADVFASKLNAAGSALAYSSYVGGSGYDIGQGIAVDNAGSAYVTGFTDSTDFPTVGPVLNTNGKDCSDDLAGKFVACYDAIIFKINAGGAALDFATYLGGRGDDDTGTAVAVDAAGNIYVAGDAGATFPTTQGALQMPRRAFAARFAPPNVGTQSTTVALTSSPNPADHAQPVTLTATLTPPDATGTVSFRDGSGAIGFARLNAGVATFSTSSLGGGSHSLSAEYLGDPDFARSQSPAVKHVVNRILLTAAVSEVVTAKGDSAAFSLTVEQDGALNAPVSFSCGDLPAELLCTFSPATVPAGSTPAQVTVTVRPGTTALLNAPLMPVGGPRLPGTVVGAGLFLLTLAFLRSRRACGVIRARLGFALALAALLSLTAACGSSDPPEQAQTPPAATVFQVRAASSTTTASISLKVLTLRN